FGGDQRHRLVEGDVLDRAVARQRGIDLAVLDIGAEAAYPRCDGLAVLRMRAELARRRPAGTPPAAGLRQQMHRAVETDIEHVVRFLARLVRALVLDIGAVTSDAGLDRLAGLRMPAHLARQGQQPERRVQRERGRIDALGNRHALGFLVLVVFVGGLRLVFDFLGFFLRAFRAVLAQLDIGAVGTDLERDGLAGLRIETELLAVAVRTGRGGGRRRLVMAVEAEAPRKLAL